MWHQAKNPYKLLHPAIPQAASLAFCQFAELCLHLTTCCASWQLQEADALLFTLVMHAGTMRCAWQQAGAPTTSWTQLALGITFCASTSGPSVPALVRAC